MRIPLKIFLALLLLTYLFPLRVVAGNSYKYDVNLNHIEDDRVKVSCKLPHSGQSTIEFIFPNLIPGSYAYKEYGRYITNFRAFDDKGKELRVKKADKYNFAILNASSVDRIEYEVNDSWEEKNGRKFIFQPGGTNINAGKNFVINNYGFFGYIEGMKNLEFEITFHKPSKLKFYSILEKTSQGDSLDYVRASTYDELGDNPIMYCPPDDATFIAGGSEIQVCVYSETNKISALQVVDALRPIGKALERFFGELPVPKYLFLFYFADENKVSTPKGSGLGSGYGALEHHRCSFYFLPDAEIDYIADGIKSTTSHEFLHILTPLNVHSREIEDFNFRIPDMSKHLWMYEGVTEYFAWLCQLQDSTISEEAFCDEFRDKIISSEKFGEFSMTEMSKNVCEKKNQKLYESVYTRGALLAMMLDLLIIDRSDGLQSLKSVMLELRNRYGPSKPFDDDSLFEEIVAMTHPDVRDYFEKYIIGKLQPDYSKFFDLIGYEYHDVYTKHVYFFGNFNLRINENGTFSFYKVGSNSLGVLEDDVFLDINNEAVSSDNVVELFKKYFIDNEEEKAITIVVERKGSQITLQATPVKGTRTIKFALMPNKSPDERSGKNRSHFLGFP